MEEQYAIVNLYMLKACPALNVVFVNILMALVWRKEDIVNGSFYA